MATDLHSGLAHFNPRPPRGGRLSGHRPGSGPSGYFNPRPPRGGRRLHNTQEAELVLISIHAPREGGDFQNSHHSTSCIQFQSTPPARGATRRRLHPWIEKVNFNPRPPRGGRPYSSCVKCVSSSFQSTPPARGATDQFGQKHPIPKFQSTPPARGATHDGGLRADRTRISIHAPREGGDLSISACPAVQIEFQSTPPARGATESASTFESGAIFQSTPPARGATLHNTQEAELVLISIHAPREGGDCISRRRRSGRRAFQSTPPARGAT